MREHANRLIETETDIVHCNQPMRVVRTTTAWAGKPGEGTELNEMERLCGTCGASLVIEYTVPA